MFFNLPLSGFMMILSQYKLLTLYCAVNVSPQKISLFQSFLLVANMDNRSNL